MAQTEHCRVCRREISGLTPGRAWCANRWPDVLLCKHCAGALRRFAQSFVGATLELWILNKLKHPTNLKYWTDATYREKQKAASKNVRRAYPKTEAKKQYRREDAALNRDKLNAAQRAYRAKNLDRCRAYDWKRKGLIYPLVRPPCKRCGKKFAGSDLRTKHCEVCSKSF